MVGPWVRPLYNRFIMWEAMASHKGQLAALATAMLWTGTAIFFTVAGKRLGTTVVNASRIAIAIVLLGVAHRYYHGVWIPEAQSRQVLFLAFSGVVGLSLGDQALFTSFAYIGPRLATLIMTTSPIFAAVLGWGVLGESLTPRALVGMGLTVSGVAWVVLERTPAASTPKPHHQLRGVLLAMVGSACQAGGLLLSKQGIGHGWLPEDQHIDAQAATLIRMAFAAVGMGPILLIYALRERNRKRTGALSQRAGRRSVGWVCTLAGAICGPFLGVWMSLVAADNAPLGIAQTLCSMVPIFIVPAVVMIHKEKVSVRAVVGAIVAVAGASLLF